MKARKLLQGSAYGPEKLKQIFRAFDRAWEAIKPIVEDTPLAHEAARLKLANIILSVVKDESLEHQAARHSSRRPRSARDKSA